MEVYLHDYINNEIISMSIEPDEQSDIYNVIKNTFSSTNEYVCRYVIAFVSLTTKEFLEPDGSNIINGSDIYCYPIICNDQCIENDHCNCIKSLVNICVTNRIASINVSELIPETLDTLRNNDESDEFSSFIIYLTLLNYDYNTSVEFNLLEDFIDVIYLTPFTIFSDTYLFFFNLALEKGYELRIINSLHRQVDIDNFNKRMDEFLSQ